MRILIVDDDPVIRKFIRRVIDKQAEILEAADQESANRLFEGGRFDIALVDVNLGADDGIELAIRFRDMDPQLIVVVMSGDPANIIRTREAGLGEMLSKPFTATELRKHIF